MITLVRIVQVVGRVKRLGRGPGILMRGTIDDGEYQIPVHAFLQTFPLGLIEHFLIGRDVSCVLHGTGDRMRAELLPFDNQPGTVISDLINILVRLANEAGSEGLDRLPMLTHEQSFLLPPTPQPEAEKLDRLLELEVETDPPEEAPF